MFLKQVFISLFVLLTLSACAHKESKGHDCACGKETSAKCAGGHCGTESSAPGAGAAEHKHGSSEKGGCADCKAAGH